jgi:hypothetical protein
MSLAGKNIVLGLTGGIACYKAAELARGLVKAGASCQVVMTEAALNIQRVYRGCRGRRRAIRKKTWEAAEPGPERLQLGLRLIEDSKQAFAAQQEEERGVARGVMWARG